VKTASAESEIENPSLQAVPDSSGSMGRSRLSLMNRKGATHAKEIAKESSGGLLRSISA
jgi:hypothetical protein